MQLHGMRTSPSAQAMAVKLVVWQVTGPQSASRSRGVRAVHCAAQVVKGGPPKGPDDIFERARQAGAEDGAFQVWLQPEASSLPLPDQQPRSLNLGAVFTRAFCLSASKHSLHGRKIVMALMRGASPHMQTAPQSSSRSGAFSGRARTLANDAAPEPAPAAAVAAPQVPEQTVHTITFYTNGIFTVDDGEPLASFPSSSSRRQAGRR